MDHRPKYKTKTFRKKTEENLWQLVRQYLYFLYIKHKRKIWSVGHHQNLKLLVWERHCEESENTSDRHGESIHNHISNTALISRIFKEFSKLQNKKNLVL